VYTNPDPNTYPISAYSYFVAQCVPASATTQNFSCDSAGNVTMGPSQGAEMAQFITYVACLGQSKMASLGYSPLPPNLVEEDFQAAGRLPGGTTPPPPTAANCQNPYITGELKPVGQPVVVGQANPGGSDVGTAVSPAAAAAAAARAAAARSSASGSSPGAGSTTASGAPGSSGAGQKSRTSLNNAALAYPRQDALAKAALHGLGRWSPAEVALWCVVFALVLVAFPLAVWFRQKRRRGQGSA
jgi:phosphate transport system substrate-binding protein